MHAKLWREVRAQKAFEVHARRLTRELESGLTPLEYLELRVELLEQYVEQTGGNLLTQEYRLMLADLKKGVALQTDKRRSKARHLAAVRT